MPMNARPRLKSLSFNKIIPNIVTLLALAAGLTSIRYGLRDEWERAVIAIILAAVFDGIDGRLARMLKGTTKFGAELDSLADAISFGVAPAILLYMWTLNDLGGIGWALALLFALCCVLRLARFNTMLGEPDLPSFAHNYFVGVPAPAGAFMVLLPMVLSFEFKIGFFDTPMVSAVMVVLVAILMVSKVPTFSMKRFRVPAQWVLPLMICVGLLAAFLVTEPWATFGLLGVVYLASIPFAVRSFRVLTARAASGIDAEPEVNDLDDDQDEYEIVDRDKKS